METTGIQGWPKGYSGDYRDTVETAGMQWRLQGCSGDSRDAVEITGIQEAKEIHCTKIQLNHMDTKGYHVDTRRPQCCIRILITQYPRRDFNETWGSSGTIYAR